MGYNIKEDTPRSDLLVMKVQDFMERCAQGQQAPAELLIRSDDTAEAVFQQL